MNDDWDKYKILKLRAEILELGSVIRQLQQAGMHDAATQAVPDEGGSRMPDEPHPRKSICRVMITHKSVPFAGTKRRF